MNNRTTCKECGQLREGELRITEIQSDENARKIVLELTSQVDRDRGLLDVFAREGIRIKRKGNTLIIEADMDVVSDDKEESTSTPEPSCLDAAPAKRRGRPPAIKKAE